MSFLFINRTLLFNNLKTRTAMKAKISVFVICVEAIIYLLLYNLHDNIFKEVSSILVDTKDSYSNNPYEFFLTTYWLYLWFWPEYWIFTSLFKNPCSLCRGTPLHNHINTVVWYNEKQKYQEYKRLNNVLTTSRHHFDIILR